MEMWRRIDDNELELEPKEEEDDYIEVVRRVYECTADEDIMLAIVIFYGSRTNYLIRYDPDYDSKSITYAEGLDIRIMSFDGREIDDDTEIEWDEYTCLPPELMNDFLDMMQETKDFLKDKKTT